MSTKELGPLSLRTGEGKIVADKVRVANSAWARFWGLLGKSHLEAGEGLCIKPCNQIHMFFMRMALDVVFVDENGVALHVLHRIQPWRASKMVWGAKAAIELPVGSLLAAGVIKGSILTLE